MKELATTRKQIILFLIFSFLLAIAGIIHGIFFDLDFEQIKRLTIGGIIFTVVVIFPILIVLERMFDINNQKRFKEIEKRIRKLENRK